MNVETSISGNSLWRRHNCGNLYPMAQFGGAVSVSRFYLLSLLAAAAAKPTVVIFPHFRQEHFPPQQL